MAAETCCGQRVRYLRSEEMMNRHEFQQSAKKFRAGRITLEEFSELVFSETPGSGEQLASPIETKEVHSPLPDRPANSHKGDCGRVLAIGGSDSMAGAISLTAMAALRSGSGLVIVATPATQQPIVAGFSPCYMTVGCPDKNGHFAKEALDMLLEKCYWADVVAVGPGMGRSKALQKIMERIYSELAQPVVLDADGLNNLAESGFDFSQHEGLRILTPHPGEFRHLIGSKSNDRQELEEKAIEFALANQVTVVLKGHCTLVTDGIEQFTNTTGNPGMATAGSGDVLTGVIASYLGAGLSSFDAARFGVEVHGRAGDLGAEKFGQASLISTDLLDLLGDAMK